MTRQIGDQARVNNADGMELYMEYHFFVGCSLTNLFVLSLYYYLLLCISVYQMIQRNPKSETVLLVKDMHVT